MFNPFIDLGSLLPRSGNGNRKARRKNNKKTGSKLLLQEVGNKFELLSVIDDDE